MTAPRIETGQRNHLSTKTSESGKNTSPSKEKIQKTVAQTLSEENKSSSTRKINKMQGKINLDNREVQKQDSLSDATHLVAQAQNKATEAFSAIQPLLSTFTKTGEWNQDNAKELQSKLLTLEASLKIVGAILGSQSEGYDFISGLTSSLKGVDQKTREKFNAKLNTKVVIDFDRDLLDPLNKAVISRFVSDSKWVSRLKMVEKEKESIRKVQEEIRVLFLYYRQLLKCLETVEKDRSGNVIRDCIKGTVRGVSKDEIMKSFKSVYLETRFLPYLLKKIKKTFELGHQVSPRFFETAQEIYKKILSASFNRGGVASYNEEVEWPGEWTRVCKYGALSVDFGKEEVYPPFDRSKYAETLQRVELNKWTQGLIKKISEYTFQNENLLDQFFNFAIALISDNFPEVGKKIGELSKRIEDTSNTSIDEDEFSLHKEIFTKLQSIHADKEENLKRKEFCSKLQAKFQESNIETKYSIAEIFDLTIIFYQVADQKNLWGILGALHNSILFSFPDVKEHQIESGLIFTPDMKDEDGNASKIKIIFEEDQIRFNYFQAKSFIHEDCILVAFTEVRVPNAGKRGEEKIKATIFYNFPNGSEFPNILEQLEKLKLSAKAYGVEMYQDEKEAAKGGIPILPPSGFNKNQKYKEKKLRS